MARALSLSWRGVDGSKTWRRRRRLPLAAGWPSWAGAESVVSEELEQNLSFFLSCLVIFGLFLYSAFPFALSFRIRPENLASLKCCVVFLYQLLSILPDYPFKLYVLYFISPALTPIWLEKWVLSACGAESAVSNMREHRLSPPFPPSGGLGGGGMQECGEEIRGGGG